MALLANAVRQETTIGKEKLKLYLFVGDMIIYLENYKESMIRLTQTTKEFSQVIGYKSNRNISNLHVYINHYPLEDKMEEKTPFKIATEKIKYL